MKTKQEIVEHARQHGERITLPRLSVIEALCEMGGHQTAQIWRSAPILPDSIDYSTLDFEAFAATYFDDLTETVTALGMVAPGDFTPSLGALDALMQSVHAGE